jgi:hypothetical protein
MVCALHTAQLLREIPCETAGGVAATKASNATEITCCNIPRTPKSEYVIASVVKQEPVACSPVSGHGRRGIRTPDILRVRQAL